MSVFDRYLGELKELTPQIAVESLTSSAGHDLFEYGKAVGRLEGLKLAERLVDKVLSESEADERGSGRNRNKA